MIVFNIEHTTKYILDTASLNAYVIFKLNGTHESGSRLNRAKFLKNLAYALVRLYMVQRMLNKYLPKFLRNETANLLGDRMDDFQQPTVAESSGRPGKCALRDYK